MEYGFHGLLSGFSDAQVDDLVGLGFSPDRARRALEIHFGDTNAAAMWLIEHGEEHKGPLQVASKPAWDEAFSADDGYSAENGKFMYNACVTRANDCVLPC